MSYAPHKFHPPFQHRPRSAPRVLGVKPDRILLLRHTFGPRDRRVKAPNEQLFIDLVELTLKNKLGYQDSVGCRVGAQPTRAGQSVPLTRFGWP